MNIKPKLAFIKANFLKQRFHGNALFGVAITAFVAAIFDTEAEPQWQKFLLLFFVASIGCLVVAGIRNFSQGQNAETAFKSNCEEISTALGGIAAFIPIAFVWLLFTLKAWNVPLLVVAGIAFAASFQIWGGFPALIATIKKVLQKLRGKK
ncbi:hypothetical protein Q765_00135 [Flavobacterium rivuli WB 3.3-2 = DSM 21788]|uniref:Uncharacterized protein n=1 Tax=Flavobacterium rivuli WB 3.3-2 = DSM 21788 TaxID=1121895 RepID=A0A0A2MJ62_9FLAO|nr:hypothetical protein [Flavobacterium rivuli]KGO88365.1 hypothetical protein Q765_00135 [Flavobacterium rivuli WB 3.3-2 = DSM 21788]